MLLAILGPLQRLNDHAGRIGGWLGVTAMALMVVAILLQVFFRYVLNNALPWPDEAARFMMLWLTGMMAPIAFRRGGMVAITSILEMAPGRLFVALNIALLLVSLVVLVIGARLGWDHVQSGWLFSSASLKLPLWLIGMKSVKIKLAWMFMSLFVGVVLMIFVNVELLLRALISAMGGQGTLRAIPGAVKKPGDAGADGQEARHDPDGARRGPTPASGGGA